MGFLWGSLEKPNSYLLLILSKIALFVLFNSLSFSHENTPEPFRPENNPDLLFNLSQEIEYYAKDWVQSGVIENDKIHKLIKASIQNELKKPIVLPNTDFLQIISKDFYKKNQDGTPSQLIGRDTKASIQFEGESSFDYKLGNIKITPQTDGSKKSLQVTIPIESLDVELKNGEIGSSYQPVDSNNLDRKFASFCEWIGCEEQTELPNLDVRSKTTGGYLSFNISLPGLGEVNTKVENLELSFGTPKDTDIKFNNTPHELNIKIPTISPSGEKSSMHATLSKEFFLQAQNSVKEKLNDNIQNFKINQETSFDITSTIEEKIESASNQWLEEKSTIEFDLPFETEINFANEAQKILHYVLNENFVESKRTLTEKETATSINTLEELKDKLSKMESIGSHPEKERKQREILSTSLAHALLAISLTGKNSEEKEYLTNLSSDLWETKKNGDYKNKIDEKEIKKIQSILLGSENNKGLLDSLIVEIENNNINMNELLIEEVLKQSEKQLKLYQHTGQFVLNSEHTDLSSGIIAINLLLEKYNSETGEFELRRPTISCDPDGIERKEPPIIRRPQPVDKNKSEFIIPLSTLNDILTDMYQSGVFNSMTKDSKIDLITAPTLDFTEDPKDPTHSQLKLKFTINTMSGTKRFLNIFNPIKKKSDSTYELEVDIDLAVDPSDPENILFIPRSNGINEKNKYNKILNPIKWPEIALTSITKLNKRIIKRHINRDLSTAQSPGFSESLASVNTEVSDIILDTSNKQIVVEFLHKKNGEKND